MHEIQRKIDLTHYCDAKVIDFQINYFGDEVCLRYVDDDCSYWEIMFLTCYQVRYETDASWRTIKYVKDMARSQRGYYCQKIEVFASEAGSDFIDVIMDLSIMDVHITCKEIMINRKSGAMQKDDNA